MSASYETEVSSELPFTLRTANLLGSDMKYIDTRPDNSSGPTALFLHGNGTSSYLWRNVIPHVAPLMRCVAPDLIGMGQSSKPSHFPYRFTDHYTYLSAFINAVVPSGPVMLVVQDWGSGLGLHWAWQQAELSEPYPSPRLLGIALMEFVHPFPTWEKFGLSPKTEQAFRAFRTVDIGRKLIIDDNAFIASLPGGQLRPFAEAELEYYGKPYREATDREVLYMWVNQIPIEHRPADVSDIVGRYHKWLLETDLPKLLFWATPGAIITPEKAEWYGRNLKNVKVIDLGAGVHNLSEDHPQAMGKSIHEWAKEYVDSKNHVT